MVMWRHPSLLDAVEKLGDPTSPKAVNQLSLQKWCGLCKGRGGGGSCVCKKGLCLCKSFQCGALYTPLKRRPLLKVGKYYIYMYNSTLLVALRLIHYHDMQ